MNYKLSPSSFSFLYEGCKRCFYLNVVHGITRPSRPMPGVFTRIANLLKSHYHGKRTEELHPEFPAGIVSHGEKRVKSKAIQLPSHKDVCYISGRFDIVVHFDDETYGVIDFKTGNPKEEFNELYARQLHAYAYALENPALGGSWAFADYKVRSSVFSLRKNQARKFSATFIRGRYSLG